MIKLLFCLRRREGMDLDEFQRYWRDTHAPLVQRHAAALGIVRYVQTHTRPSPEADAVRASRGAPEPYDGVAEIWFPSAEAITASAESPEGLAAAIALFEDEARFVDHARSPLFLAEEHEVIASVARNGSMDAETAWDEP